MIRNRYRHTGRKKLNLMRISSNERGIINDTLEFYENHVVSWLNHSKRQIHIMQQDGRAEQTGNLRYGFMVETASKCEQLLSSIVKLRKNIYTKARYAYKMDIHRFYGVPASKKITLLKELKKEIKNMSKEKAYEFFKLVERMRKAQQDYFKFHTTASLNESKKLERQVDEIIASANKKLAERQQLTMFQP